MIHPRHKIAFARKLRRNYTDAEKFLWGHLRNRQLKGVKFRRQEPIGTYIVDFVSIDDKVIIELDGGQHNEEKIRANDRERTRFLQSEGYRVLRFWNNDVLRNIGGVIEEIALAFSPHPDPLPEGEGNLRERGNK